MLSNDVKVNDYARIVFDMTTKDCSFYWNGEFLDILHYTLPKKLFPAISCQCPIISYVGVCLCELECTKWEFA